MPVTFIASAVPASGALVTLVGADNKQSAFTAQLDAVTGGQISAAINNSRFSGKQGQSLELIMPANTGLSRLLLCGIGDADTLTQADKLSLGGNVAKYLRYSGETGVTISVDGIQDAAVDVAEGVMLWLYSFDKYHTKKEDDAKISLRDVTVLSANPEQHAKVFAKRAGVLDGVTVTRDLVSEPANILYPAEFANRAKQLESLGVEVEILDEARLTELGFGALLCVGQGSARESKVAIMRWNGGKTDEQPLAFVGKGVCFDTGGISLKPANGMEDMKWDMGGAGAVTGLMHALAARKAAVNVIGIIGLVENMPSGTAVRPGDVVTSYSGQTIEVLNTDAEGRLVLADLLWYCQEQYKPRFMINLATLTGAILVALGEEKAGLFSNDDTIATQLTNAGIAAGDEVWRLPIGKAYNKLLDSPIADMQNISPGRWGGSITAACFLERFVNGTPWAHLDVAGMVWAAKDRPLTPKGASGFGVRLLDRFVADYYEG